MPSPDRYYYQHNDLHAMFATNWQTGWQIYDRQSTTKQGEARPIAWATDKGRAQQITAALNEIERRISP